MAFYLYLAYAKNKLDDNPINFNWKYMPFLKLFIEMLKIAPYLVDSYQDQRKERVKKNNNKHKERINENPIETFSDDFGPASGSVQLDKSIRRKLPSDAKKS
ncbi:hypothetical protein [Vibrio sp.]|uniref:hypothetical protein n=1 Tax=Vibrio sp. TaxID=678 RepID=UPI00311F2BDC